MRKFHKILLYPLKYIAFLILSFNIYANPDPDSIIVALRVNMAMQEFYAIQAQNAWNDANGYSENNAYIFGMGNFLENPEDEYDFMKIPDGGKDVLINTNTIRDEVLTQVNKNLVEYNTEYSGLEEPYEIWIYLTPLHVPLIEKFLMSNIELDPEDRGLFKEKDYETLYESLKDRQLHMTIKEAEELEYRVWEAVGEQLQSTSKKKLIIFNYSIYIDSYIQKRTGQISLSTHSFFGIHSSLIHNNPGFLNYEVIQTSVLEIKEELLGTHTSYEESLIVFPEAIKRQIDRYFFGEQEEGMVKFEMSMPKFCTVASICQYLGIVELDMTNYVRTFLNIKDPNYEMDDPDYEKFQKIATASEKDLRHLYVTEEGVSIPIQIPIEIIPTKTIDLANFTFMPHYNLFSYMKAYNIPQNDLHFLLIEALNPTTNIQLKYAKIRVPKTWASRDFINSFRSNCEEPVVVMAKKLDPDFFSLLNMYGTGVAFISDNPKNSQIEEDIQRGYRIDSTRNIYIDDAMDILGLVGPMTASGTGKSAEGLAGNTFDNFEDFAINLWYEGSKRLYEEGYEKEIINGEYANTWVKYLPTGEWKFAIIRNGEFKELNIYERNFENLSESEKNYYGNPKKYERIQKKLMKDRSIFKDN